MPFRCPYCDQSFCVQHRLPENHDCPEYWRAKAPRDKPAATPTTQTEPLYQYKVTMMPPRSRIIWFSTTELKHLVIGIILTLTIGFSMPLYGARALYGSPLIISALAVIFSLSFIIHELAHKMTAQRFGMWAEFRITVFGALITLLSIISPFKIISPGAVVIGGVADKKTIGKAAVAGPLTNVALALFFLISLQILEGPIALSFEFGLLINSFIALFNLIPFGVLDGLKVFSWNKAAWVSAFCTSLLLTVCSYLGFQLL